MLAIKEIVRIIGRRVGTFIIADIFFIQVGTLKFADISLQVGTFNNAYDPLIFIFFSRSCTKTKFYILQQSKEKTNQAHFNTKGNQQIKIKQKCRLPTLK